MTTLLATVFLTSILLKLALIDIRTLRLPDIWTLPLIASGLGLSALTGQPELSASLIGGIAGYAIFWLIGSLYYRRTGVDGLGLGDAKLFAASGTWLGYALLPYVLLIAAVGALIFTLFKKNSRTNAIPFGPWLAFGFLAVWLYSAPLNV